MKSDGEKTSLGEFGLIARIASEWPRMADGMPLGIGDDAALLQHAGGRQFCVTTDLLLERVHFSFDYCSPADVGYKSAMVNLSDVAAMGARPRWAFLSLALKKKSDPALFEGFMAGFSEALKKHGVILAGGDMSASLSDACVSVTVIGEHQAGCAVLRSGAKAGDDLYVCGELGLSRAGLEMFLEKPHVQPEDAGLLSHAHRRPEALVECGLFLGESRLLNSMIDVSDGLAGDAAHIAEESAVALEIETSLLDARPELKRFAALRGGDVLDYLLRGGEDYALLFSLAPANAAELLKEFPAGLPHPRRIGRVVAGSGVYLVDSSGLRSPCSRGGFDHFS